jgi:adenosylcobinamide-phosphate synthase
MTRAALVAGSVLIDALAGDPPALPHPVRAIGATIAAVEPVVRAALPATPAGELAGGALLSLGVIAGASLVAAMTTRIPAAELAAGASTLALRNLLDEAGAVAHKLDAGDLAGARVQVARIVGRDTAGLDYGGVARATIETLAESTCDGVIAPLCYLTVGGVPAAYAFKAVSTLDSMIGHLEAPYTSFGRFAARLDDAANYVPARLTAIAIVCAAQILFGRGAPAYATWMRDGDCHRSPNAGQTEAAMAGALGVRLGGPNAYAGTTMPGAVFGAEYRPAHPGDVGRAMTVCAVASSLAYGLAIAVARAIDARA